MGSISPSDFDGQLSEVLAIFCLCHTFSMNGLVFFGFCCVEGAGFIAVTEGSISLPHLIGNH